MIIRTADSFSDEAAKSSSSQPCGEDDFKILLPTKSYTRIPTRCGTSTKATQVTGGTQPPRSRIWGLAICLPTTPTPCLRSWIATSPATVEFQTRCRHRKISFWLWYVVIIVQVLTAFVLEIPDRRGESRVGGQKGRQRGVTRTLALTLACHAWSHWLQAIL